MAIVNLGTVVIPVGGTPQSFSPFSINNNRAYGIYFSITAAQPTNIFSFLRVTGQYTRDDGLVHYYHSSYDIEILESPKFLLFPFSNIYNGNGSFQPIVSRVNRIRGGGDSGDVTIQAQYDDEADIRTWL